MTLRAYSHTDTHTHTHTHTDTHTHAHTYPTVWTDFCRVDPLDPLEVFLPALVVHVSTGKHQSGKVPLSDAAVHWIEPFKLKCEACMGVRMGVCV